MSDLPARAEQLLASLKDDAEHDIEDFSRIYSVVSDLLALVQEQAQQIATLTEKVEIARGARDLHQARSVALEAQLATLTQKREMGIEYGRPIDVLRRLRERAEAAEAREKEAKTLAKQATNGWACYARTQKEHAEIARLHTVIDGLGAALEKAKDE